MIMVDPETGAHYEVTLKVCTNHEITSQDLGLNWDESVLDIPEDAREVTLTAVGAVLDRLVALGFDEDDDVTKISLFRQWRGSIAEKEAIFPCSARFEQLDWDAAYGEWQVADDQHSPSLKLRELVWTLLFHVRNRARCVGDVKIKQLVNQLQSAGELSP